MKKWIMPIGVTIVICILAMNMTMPISLADQNRIEISGTLTHEEIVYIDHDVSTVGGVSDHYEIGELQKGDKVKITITDMRGAGDIEAKLEYVTKPIPCACCFRKLGLIQPRPVSEIAPPPVTFTHEGQEETFIVPANTNKAIIRLSAEGSDVNYKGYIEVIKGNIEA